MSEQYPVRTGGCSAVAVARLRRSAVESAPRPVALVGGCGHREVGAPLTTSLTRRGVRSARSMSIRQGTLSGKPSVLLIEAVDAAVGAFEVPVGVVDVWHPVDLAEELSAGCGDLRRGGFDVVDAET